MLIKPARYQKKRHNDDKVLVLPKTLYRENTYDYMSKYKHHTPTLDYNARNAHSYATDGLSCTSVIISGAHPRTGL